MKYVIVYNASLDNQTLDSEGHTVEPGAFAAGEVDYTKPLVDAEHLIVIDPEVIREGESSPLAIMVKQEVERLNSASQTPKATGGNKTKK